MQIDQHSYPIFNAKDLMDELYKGNDIDKEAVLALSTSEEISKYNQYAAEFGYQLLTLHRNIDLDTSAVDKICQSEWYMPTEYIELDVVEWLISKLPNDEKYQTRLAEEISAFIDVGWLDLLKWLKYFVDTCRKHHVVWGVGRGSSVSSYVLYLIGVHKIDPVKYDLDWKEFLRSNSNG